MSNSGQNNRGGYYRRRRRRTGSGAQSASSQNVQNSGVKASSTNGKTSGNSAGSNNRKKGGNGFSRPGPFGFKSKPLPIQEQAVANPFGFASHNVVNVGSEEDENPS